MTEVSALWKKYTETRDIDTRNQLVESYLPLVRSLAWLRLVRLPWSVRLDDLVSAGAIGLIQSVERFSPDREVKFETFATWRIQGAISDELRSVDHLSRTQRSSGNLVEVVSIEESPFRLECEGTEPPWTETDGNDAFDGLLREVRDADADRMRRLLDLYFRRRLHLSRVALKMGVSESRASQLKKRCLARMKLRLSEKRRELFESIVA